MRCPKCGFISFDHLEECLKCKRNIKSASSSLDGAVYNVAAPGFLSFEEKTEDAQVVSTAESGAETEEIDLQDEFVDEDLDLLDTDDEEEEAEISLEVESEESQEISLGDFEEEAEDSGEEIEIDMEQFGDSLSMEPESAGEEALEGATIESEQSIDISIPDELADISDLEPPSPAPQEPPPAASAAKEEGTKDMELDDLDFDLGLEGLDSAKTPVGSQSPVMDLDDIDFSDALDQGGEEKEKKESVMDDDLDFDLDLGGLTLDNDK